MENQNKFYAELSKLLTKHKVAITCKAKSDYKEVLFQFYSNDKVVLAKTGRNHLTATDIQRLSTNNLDLKVETLSFEPK
ncbi:MAG: hypothetical protein COB38_08740 [Gammaproteobacteria bacterium]|nr:MAG: hypothetical protein COB38_12980 [Gammaproteobacteria bacterium]PCI68517.1 MAG: hypothetical protein COB38_08740 [Gammaproteobacteria bacterium]